MQQRGMIMEGVIKERNICSLRAARTDPRKSRVSGIVG